MDLLKIKQESGANSKSQRHKSQTYTVIPEKFLVTKSSQNKKSSLESRLSNKKYGSLFKKVNTIDDKMNKVFKQQEE